MSSFGGKIVEPLRLENVLDLIREVLMIILTIKLKFFFLYYYAFSRRNGSFIFPINGGAQKRKF